MKALGHFIFGFVSALLIMMLIFDHTMEIVLHDYYIEKFFTDWYPYWNTTNLTITILWGICAIMWVYHLGISSAPEIKDEPLIKKEYKEYKENE